tara:strand:+ start:544 stop:663 length:120 start_codon:yes stop_codon:yes gene_type:complete
MIEIMLVEEVDPSVVEEEDLVMLQMVMVVVPVVAVAVVL